MKDLIRRPTAIAMLAALTLLPAMPLRADSPTDGSGEPPPPPLRETIQKGYPELFDLAPTLRLEPREIQELRQSFKSGEDACRRTFRNHAKSYGKQIEDARRNLKTGGEKLANDKRHDLHCAWTVRESARPTDPEGSAELEYGADRLRAPRFEERLAESEFVLVDALLEKYLVDDRIRARCVVHHSDFFLGDATLGVHCGTEPQILNVHELVAAAARAP